MSDAPIYEAGIYTDVPIISQGFEVSSEKGTPGFYLEVNPGGKYTRKIQWWLPDGDEAAIDRWMQGLESLGLPLEHVNAPSNLDPRIEEGHVSFVGYQISAVCKHEVFKDKVRDRWEAPYSGRAPKPLEDSKIRMLDSLFGAKFKTRPKITATAKKLNAEAESAAAGAGAPF
jgi:hypothetical protein